MHHVAQSEREAAVPVYKETGGPRRNEKWGGLGRQELNANGTV